MAPLELTRKLPDEIKLAEVVRVIAQFHKDSGSSADIKGFLAGTLESFSLATFLNSLTHDLWISHENGTIKGYILAQLAKASDNKPCYMIQQTWFCEEYRNTILAKETWGKVKARAKQLFCQQIIIFSIRSLRGYQKLLGENLTHYAELLHLKLED